MCDRAAQLASRFAQIDTNSNGTLEKSELTAVFGEFAGQFLSFCDGNSDGALTCDEFTSGIINDAKDLSDDDFQTDWLDRMTTCIAAAAPSAADPNTFNFGAASNLAFSTCITCASDEAREAWAQGFGFMLNYNHEMAIGKYMECLEKDPKCAMAHWGIAYSLSSSYNWPPGLGSGYDSCEAANGLKEGLTELEIDLIDALATRHSAEAKASADPTQLKMGNDPALNIAFATAMEPVFIKHSTNLDVTAIYVEALMNLKPWKLWDKAVVAGEDGQSSLNITPADDNTTKLISIIESALGMSEANSYAPQTAHPALLHLYCHAMELSPTPEQAVPCANMLWNTVPDGGHLVHMPSHIYAWAGMWKEGVECNKEGVAADEKYVRLSKNENQFYKFYRMHNMHFVVWCAMFEGQYNTAMEYARMMEAQNPAGDKDSGVQFMLAGCIPMGAVFLESYVTSPWHVMVRFGKWDDIIAEPLRTDKSVFPNVMVVQRYARGVAFASKGMVAEAEAELALFLEARQNVDAAVPLAARVQHNVPVTSQHDIQEKILIGEIEYRKAFLAKKDGGEADFEKAWAPLKEAIDMSLNLPYNEPWGQMQPVRHILGALKLEQGAVDEAEAIYRADIKLWKDNMWGLLGLRNCLKQKGVTGADLDEVQAKFESASARADEVPKVTCLCAQVPCCGGD
jgi:tetratricopeptide (TPR) repeat protein